MKVELFMDLSKYYITDNASKLRNENFSSLTATNLPIPKITDYDRFKITVNIPDRYFKNIEDFDITVEDIVLCNDEIKE